MGHELGDTINGTMEISNTISGNMEISNSIGNEENMGVKSKEQQDEKPNASESPKEQEEKHSVADAQAQQQEERQKVVHSDVDGDEGVVESETNNNKVNIADMGGSDDDDGHDESEEDEVLVPMNPYLPPPFSAERSDGLKARQMQRRKRLFAAKSVLLEHPRNQKRRKRPAFKSVSPQNVTTITTSSIGRRKEVRHSPLRKPKSKSQTTAAAAARTKDAGDKDASNTRPKRTAAAFIPTGARTKTTGHSAANNSSNIAAATTSTSAGKGAPPIEVFRGPPDEELPGGWPSGWTKILLERQSGVCKGNRDRYWFSPGGRKFRSMVEVRKFLRALSLPRIKGDEAEAHKIYKSVKL